MSSTVDRFWSSTLGIDGTTLRSPGVRVVADAPGLNGYQGLWILRLGEGCTIAAPGRLANEIRDRTDGRAADDVFGSDEARALAGEHAGLVFGPSVHAYLDAATFVPSEPCDARKLGDDAEAVLAPLRAAIDGAEWSEGGFGDPLHGELWAVFDNAAIVAAGNMTDFFGTDRDDVGLATHPDHRGRGFGTRLAAAMIADALQRTPVVRYRALATNVASRAVSRRLGFIDDGANIAVRPRER